VKLQRRFILDNPDLVGTPDESDEESPEDTEGTHIKKKRKRTTGGRIPKGEDFWSKVDAFFTKEIAKRGRHLVGTQWKEYVHWINDLRLVY
jgi:hypothetical protein